ncbi:hypothetical protein DOA20_26505 [Salmonella enterica subsp. enterica serovar Newport]|nr:hypothetical protein [Salmonella enterica subsp. enterica serovar Newport]EDM0764306.1 hypothetical protein [Salmonella enterica]
MVLWNGPDSYGPVAGALAGKNAIENNTEGWTLPKGMTDYGQSSSTLATTMAQAGESPQAVSSALETNARGSLPEGQRPATGLVKDWGAEMSTTLAPFLLPSEATVGSILGSGAISGAANLSNQIASGGPISTTDALVSTGIGAVT